MARRKNPDGTPREKLANEAYYTPQALADACVNEVQYFAGEVGHEQVLEPACGDGSFVRAVSKRCPFAQITAVDIDPAVSADVHCSFLDLDPEPGFRLVVGNPPYTLAQEFVQHGLKFLAPHGMLAFLLRNTWQGSARRKAWLFGEGRPQRSIRVFPRPSFTTDGKLDMCEYDLVIWHPKTADVRRVHYLDWGAK
jgi:hypothetical protein